jgi:hypothetical protein
MWRLSLSLVYIFLDKDHEMCIWLCFHLDVKKLQPKVVCAIFLFDLKLPKKKINDFWIKNYNTYQEGQLKIEKKLFNFFGDEMKEYNRLCSHIFQITNSYIENKVLKTKKNLMFNFLYWGVQQQDLKITWHNGCNHHILLQKNQ